MDGAGQLGEGFQWFRGVDPIGERADPRIRFVRSTAAVDEMVGDGAPIYPASRGVKRFLRRLIFVKPNLLLVIDDIETDAERQLELRFHPAVPGTVDSLGVFHANGKNAALRIHLLTPESVTIAAGDIAMKDRYGKSAPLYTLQFVRHTRKWRNAVAISWAPAGTQPDQVKIEQRASCWKFSASHGEFVVHG